MSWNLRRREERAFVCAYNIFESRGVGVCVYKTCHPFNTEGFVVSSFVQRELSVYRVLCAVCIWTPET